MTDSTIKKPHADVTRTVHKPKRAPVSTKKAAGKPFANSAQAKPSQAQSTDRAYAETAQRKCEKFRLYTKKGRCTVSYKLVKFTMLSPSQTHITIYCTGFAVSIEGKNLEELADRIDAEKESAIRETSSDEVIPDGKPVVTKITLLFGKNAQPDE